jgi:hypothetical protein
MSIEYISIDIRGSIDISDTQVTEFIRWAQERYVNYSAYRLACNENVNTIDRYIRTNIFTRDMKSIWRQAEPYIDISDTNENIKRLQTYRKRLVTKIKYMKVKLGKLAWPVESAEEVRRQRATSPTYVGPIMREDGSGMSLYIDEVIPIYVEATIPCIKEKYLCITNDIAEKYIKESCAICLDKHIIGDICMPNCGNGHIFGADCFRDWKLNTCPLCRSTCSEITVFKLSNSNS